MSYFDGWLLNWSNFWSQWLLSIAVCAGIIAAGVLFMYAAAWWSVRRNYRRINREALCEMQERTAFWAGVMDDKFCDGEMPEPAGIFIDPAPTIPPEQWDAEDFGESPDVQTTLEALPAGEIITLPDPKLDGEPARFFVTPPHVFQCAVDDWHFRIEAPTLEGLHAVHAMMKLPSGDRDGAVSASIGDFKMLDRNTCELTFRFAGPTHAAVTALAQDLHPMLAELVRRHNVRAHPMQ